MNCRATMRLLGDYLEGHLEPAESSAFRLHIALCKNCRFLLNDSLTTLETYFEKPREAAPKHRHHAA